MYMLVWEPLKIISWSPFIWLPAILPMPWSWLNFNFQALFKAKSVAPGIHCNSEESLPISIPTSFVKPSAPCILVAAHKSWQFRSNCCAGFHVRMKLSEFLEVKWFEQQLLPLQSRYCFRGEKVIKCFRFKKERELGWRWAWVKF